MIALAGTPSPLRASVVFLVEERGMCTATACAAMAGVSLPRAKAYLERLRRLGVVTITEERVVPSLGWQAFTTEETTTRPVRSRSAMAEDYQRQHEERMAQAQVVRMARGSLAIRKVAELANVAPSTWWRVEYGHRTVERATLWRMIKAAREARGGVWWDA